MTTKTTPFVLDELVARCLGDREFAGELLGIFARQVPAMLAEFQAATGKESWEEAGRAIHAMKGSSGNLAARRVYAASVEIDKSLRTGDIAGGRARFEELAQAVREACDAVPAMAAELQLLRAA